MGYEKVLEIVKAEMQPSLGCTEPVAIGLAVSNTCRYLERVAEGIKIKVSSNIFKNAYCVKIPNTEKAGIPLAAALGCILAAQNNDMQMFSAVDAAMVEKAEKLLCNNFVEIEVMSSQRFYIEVWAKNSTEQAHTLTLDRHDNLVLAEKNGKILIESTAQAEQGERYNQEDIVKYSVKELVQLAESINIKDIEFLQEAAELNMAASHEGLRGNYGMNVGRSISRMIEDGVVPNDLFYHVKMVVAAAADCRMGGGPLVAMAVLGSGNQGFQATLPTIAACNFLKKDNECMLRALFMAITITIRQKYKVGRLSPICGAILSAAASAAVITRLLGGSLEQMEGAMRTMYANITGMMCDGAKDGCAMKLATCSGEAVMAARLALYGSMATSTDGIVSARVEDCIDNVAKLSQEGMKDVDMQVIDIMMSKEA